MQKSHTLSHDKLVDSIMVDRLASDLWKNTQCRRVIHFCMIASQY